MTHRKAARLTAVAFFFTWLFLAIAGADWPPPPGFPLVIALILALAALVDVRTRAYLDWTHTWAGVALRALGEGMVAGMGVALFFVLITPVAERPPAETWLVWFGVLGVAGGVSAIVSWLTAGVIALAGDEDRS